MITSSAIKCIKASLLQPGDILLEAERPLARVIHRKAHKDVLIWRPEDSDDPWDVLPQAKEITIYRPAIPNFDLLVDLIAAHLHQARNPSWPGRWGWTEVPRDTKELYRAHAWAIVTEWQRREDATS